LALHLNKLEFLSCKNGLYQVWLKFTRCFILKDSSQYSHVKIVSPLVAPPNPWEPWFVQAWICTISGSSHVNLSYFGSVVLEKKKFHWPNPYLHFCDYLPLDENLALHLDNLLFSSPKDDLYKIWLTVALEKRIFVFNINMVFPTVPPPDPWGPWFE
jgi:hypothetical protein